MTLPTRYQRWLYEDYAYLWRQQTGATRLTYASAGSRYHLTGFQYWMKYQLTNLPDIAGMWYLDEKTGTTARDFSRNANHGTIIGASPAVGLIAGAQSFDGINDYIRIPYSSSLGGFTALTIEMSLYPTAYGFPTFARVILNNGYPTPGSIYMELTKTVAARILGYVYNDAGAWAGFINNGITALDTWYHLAFVWDGSTVCLYINNTPGSNPAFVGTMTREAPINLSLNTNDFQGIIDHFVIYNRALDATERLRHSERRWPA